MKPEGDHGTTICNKCRKPTRGYYPAQSNIPVVPKGQRWCGPCVKATGFKLPAAFATLDAEANSTAERLAAIQKLAEEKKAKETARLEALRLKQAPIDKAIEADEVRRFLEARKEGLI